MSSFWSLLAPHASFGRVEIKSPRALCDHLGVVYDHEEAIFVYDHLSSRLKALSLSQQPFSKHLFWRKQRGGGKKSFPLLLPLGLGRAT